MLLLRTLRKLRYPTRWNPRRRERTNLTTKQVSEIYRQARVSGNPRYLGHEQREGWKGFLPIYALYCPDCGEVKEVYPAGHAERLACPLALQHAHNLRPVNA